MPSCATWTMAAASRNAALPCGQGANMTQVVRTRLLAQPLYHQRAASVHGQVHRHIPHGQFDPRRKPNTPEHGSRGRSWPKLRGQTSRRTEAPDLRPDTAHTSAAAWQASRHVEPPALHRETGTQRSARQQTPGILRASLEPASVSKRKGTAQTHDEKVRAPGGAQRAKIVFSIVQVAKRGI